MKKRSLQEELGRLSGVLMSNKSAGSRFAWNPYFPPGGITPGGRGFGDFLPGGRILRPCRTENMAGTAGTRGIAGNSGRNKRGEPG